MAHLDGVVHRRFRFRDNSELITTVSSSSILDGDLGPFHQKLLESGAHGIVRVGDNQSFEFPNAFDANPHDGPYWLSADEKIDRRR